MPAFDRGRDHADPGYLLMRDTFVTLFWQHEHFDIAIGRLRGAAYQVVEIDAAGWLCDTDMHRGLAAAFSFPEHYGGSLNALNECLQDIANYQYAAVRHAAGTVLALRGFQTFHRYEPRTAQLLLEMFARRARSALLHGHRMLCLVQSDNPRIAFAPIGAVPVAWNDAEWLNSSRSL